jgi:tripartite-type tricarboxylate transporter receptor subunit TctC
MTFMKIPRRKLLHLAAAVALVQGLPEIASALDYPTRPVRLILSFPAGGPNDVVGRLLAQWLSERLGQPFIIENRSGAGGTVGTEVVVRAPPDGYTLLQVNTPNAINATLYDNLNYNLLLGGQVQVLIDPIPASIGYLRAGKLHALAVTTTTRARTCSQMCRRSMNSSRVTRQVHGTASARPEARLAKSSTHLTRQSTPASLIPF